MPAYPKLCKNNFYFINKIKKHHKGAFLFMVDTAGSSPLAFFKTIFPSFYLCLEKVFGHRLKPFPESFFDGWGSTLAFCHTIPHK